MFRKFAVIRDNIDILASEDPLDPATAAQLEASPEARARHAKTVLEPRLAAKYPELAKNAADRASVARELADLSWGKDSRFSDPRHVQTLIGLARNRTITREDLALRLQDDASWVCQFQDWESLGIAKWKPARDPRSGEIKLTREHLTPADIRQGTLKNIQEESGSK
jgi:hypothetical protein